jgi:hypothetical protein
LQRERLYGQVSEANLPPSTKGKLVKIEVDLKAMCEVLRKKYTEEEILKGLWLERPHFQPPEYLARWVENAGDGDFHSRLLLLASHFVKRIE